MLLANGRTGRVAQLGERLVRNEEAGGSNPLSSTIFQKKRPRACQTIFRSGLSFLSTPSSFFLAIPLLFLLPAAVCLVALSKILRYWPAHDPKRPSQINAGRTARLGLGQAHDASCKRFPNIRPSSGEDLRQKTGAGSAPWLLGQEKRRQRCS